MRLLLSLLIIFYTVSPIIAKTITYDLQLSTGVLTYKVDKSDTDSSIKYQLISDDMPTIEAYSVKYCKRIEKAKSFLHWFLGYPQEYEISKMELHHRWATPQLHDICTILRDKEDNIITEVPKNCIPRRTWLEATVDLQKIPLDLPPAYPTHLSDSVPKPQRIKSSMPHISKDKYIPKYPDLEILSKWFSQQNSDVLTVNDVIKLGAPENMNRPLLDKCKDVIIWQKTRIGRIEPRNTGTHCHPFISNLSGYNGLVFAFNNFE